MACPEHFLSEVLDGLKQFLKDNRALLLDHWPYQMKLRPRVEITRKIL